MYRYVSADGELVLMVQILAGALYDAVPINPREPVEIGDRGRHGVGTSGSANVQFAKGKYSVTLRVAPMSGSPATALVEPMLEIARIAAERMGSWYATAFRRFASLWTAETEALEPA